MLAPPPASSPAVKFGRYAKRLTGSYRMHLDLALDVSLAVSRALSRSLSLSRALSVSVSVTLVRMIGRGCNSGKEQTGEGCGVRLEVGAGRGEVQGEVSHAGRLYVEGERILEG